MKQWRIAVYLRISNEDEESLESHSITGQRSLIDDFIQNSVELSGGSVLEFVDDGYSGTNFNRPNFTKMIEKVKCGEIDCIIVKDLSRFGRNYIEVSRFMEQIFPFLGVRFISINDSYDSDKYKGTTAGLEIPFQNLIYEMYSKDISKKVKSSKKAKMKRGEWISAYAIYGYKKSLRNKNILEIDEPAADIVRKIFEMSCGGDSPRIIAISLNEEKILSPAAYKKSQGEVRNWKVHHQNNIWTAPAVRRILMDQRYTGVFIGGQWETVKMGSRKSRKTEPDNWIVVEDKLPIIVSKDIFKKSLQMIAQRTCKKIRTDEVALLSRKVYCGFCGYAMSRKDCKSHYYYCETLKYTTKYGCGSNHLSEKVLIDTVLCVIRMHAKLACDVQCLWQVQIGEITRELSLHQKELQSLFEHKEKMISSKMSLYENYRKLKWTKEKYIREREKLEEKISKDESLIDLAKKFIDSLHSKIDAQNNNNFIEAFAKFGAIQQLDRVMIEELIERIDLYDTRHIKVTVKYADEYQKLLTELQDVNCVTLPQVVL